MWRQHRKRPQQRKGRKQRNQRNRPRARRNLEADALPATGGLRRQPFPLRGGFLTAAPACQPTRLRTLCRSRVFLRPSGEMRHTPHAYTSRQNGIILHKNVQNAHKFVFHGIFLIKSHTAALPLPAFLLSVFPVVTFSHLPMAHVVRSRLMLFILPKHKPCSFFSAGVFSSPWCGLPHFRRRFPLDASPIGFILQHDITNTGESHACAAAAYF